MNSKIKTVPGAFKYLGLDIKKNVPNVSKVPAHLKEHEINAYYILIVTEALNKEANGGKRWIPDWNDSNQKKWRPWFDMQKSNSNPSGFRFVDSYFGSSCTHAWGGSRLCYISEGISDYIATKFIKIFKKVMK